MYRFETNTTGAGTEIEIVTLQIWKKESEKQTNKQRKGKIKKNTEKGKGKYFIIYRYTNYGGPLNIHIKTYN